MRTFAQNNNKKMLKFISFGSGRISRGDRHLSYGIRYPQAPVPMTSHVPMTTSRIKDGTLVLVDKEIVGNLDFTRYEEE